MTSRLLEPPVDVIRLSRDERVAALLDEHGWATVGHTRSPGLVVPLRLKIGRAAPCCRRPRCSAPREVTLSELAIEAFYAADAATRSRLMAGASG